MKQPVLLTIGFMAGSLLAFGQEVTLTSATSAAQVRIAPVPELAKDEKFFFVTWEGFSVEPRSGGMIYRREADVTERRFLAVGEGGPFGLVERNEKVLVNGTQTPVYRMVMDDPANPIQMQVSPSQKPKASDLSATYDSHEGLTPASASKAEVQTAFERAGKAFQEKCGVNPVFQVQWQGFAAIGQVGLASAAAAAALGLAHKCREPDYRAAIKKIGAFKVSFDGSLKPDDFRLKHSGSSVEIAIGKSVMNPRERAERWISQVL